MKTLKIGLPRYLYYNKYKEFIKNYFEYLGYNMILSNKEQNRLINTKRCYIYKQYITHILSIKDKCDYIIIPYERNDYTIESTCSLLENINNIIKNEIPNILTFNIRNKLTIIPTTLKINKNIPKIIISYILAEIDYHNKKRRLIKQEYEKFDNTSHHLLVAAYSYIDYEIRSDRYKIIYSRNLDNKKTIDYSKNYPYKIENIEIKKIIGSIYYCKEIAERIILININKCKYNLRNYLEFLDNKTKKKIIIINI